MTSPRHISGVYKAIRLGDFVGSIHNHNPRFTISWPIYKTHLSQNVLFSSHLWPGNKHHIEVTITNNTTSKTIMKMHSINTMPYVSEWPLPQTTPSSPAEESADEYDGPEIIQLANKLCSHSGTHGCRNLVDSRASLCSTCAWAVSKGQPCP